MTQKSLLRIDPAPPAHWVGDGFHVHGMFSYNQDAELYSPFLMLDYGAPHIYAPNPAEPRGVGTHPHRGFETVSIAYTGEIAHRDSAGGGGIIGAGDVQWMTAGSGIVHNEFHSPAFSAKGGEMHMVQLWVNLPAKSKMTPPGYQAISKESIPSITNDAATVRVIAGEYGAEQGAATTFTPMNVLDVQLKAGQTIDLPQPAGWTTLLLVQSGAVQVNGSAAIAKAQLAVLSRAGSEVTITASLDARVLLLAGEPINEPVFGHGPFVMNTRQEIVQAIDDFNSGKFGHIAA